MVTLNCFKLALDNWYPNINDSYVEVSLYNRGDGTDPLVCVWGGDDCGMEYIGPEAEYKFHRLLEEEALSQAICKRIGLESC